MFSRIRIGRSAQASIAGPRIVLGFGTYTIRAQCANAHGINLLYGRRNSLQVDCSDIFETFVCLIIWTLTEVKYYKGCTKYIDEIYKRIRARKFGAGGGLSSFPVSGLSR